jgi:hypothetical protein
VTTQAMDNELVLAGVVRPGSSAGQEAARSVSGVVALTSFIQS